MFKAMILMRRKDGMSREAFRQWWIESHAPLARQLPGLERAVFNLTLDGEEYDGISELWFRSRQDFEDAYACDTGKKVAADSLANVSLRQRLLVEEHPVF